MLTEAGRRGRLQGGELSCGGLEGGEGGDEGVELGSGGLGGGEGGGEGGVLGFGGLRVCKHTHMLIVTDAC
jgi:hypothetical protein